MARRQADGTPRGEDRDGDGAARQSLLVVVGENQIPSSVHEKSRARPKLLSHMYAFGDSLRQETKKT